MGATNTTTYYNLSQFIGTDKPAWLQDYNGDMLKIDTAINNAKTAADSAANAASAAQNDATTALGDITTINGQIGTINTTLGTAVGAINTINALIGNGTPTTTDQTIIGAINELNVTVSRAKNKLALEGEFEAAKIIADGVKTYSALMDDLHAAFESFVAGIDARERVEILSATIGNWGDFATKKEYIYANDSSVGSLGFMLNNHSAGNFIAQSAVCATSGSSIRSLNVTDTNVVTNSAVEGIVPGSGAQFIIYVNKYYLM